MMLKNYLINNKEHPLIVRVKERLNETINKFHKIEDPKKSIRSDDMATDLIRELIRIRFFRLKVQEPVVKYMWYLYNNEINPNLMEDMRSEENTDEVNEDDNSLVELCYFPLFVAQITVKKIKKSIHVQKLSIKLNQLNR
jgi:hypothetical protein